MPCSPSPCFTPLPPCIPERTRKGRLGILTLQSFFFFFFNSEKTNFNYLSYVEVLKGEERRGAARDF